jgi:4-amino-4-deoxy-L-arabinose transferase-like glycosyltransferase
MAVFGMGEFAARLPNALCGMRSRWWCCSASGA